jgi:hypothetical protein
VEAAKVGALASLIRSVASFSIYRLVIVFVWNFFRNDAFPWKRSPCEVKTNQSNENTDCSWNSPHFTFGHLFVICSLAFSGFQASFMHSFKKLCTFTMTP